MKNFSTGRLGGFTLIELLVVVLIIGILSAVALPQYQMAVTKSRVATMLPLMRRWSDAAALFKVENGSYCPDSGPRPGSAELGVSWPSEWTCDSAGECSNDYWDCMANDECLGEVYCIMKWLGDGTFIQISQPDDPQYSPGRTCAGDERVCKALGGKKIPGDVYYEF